MDLTKVLEEVWRANIRKGWDFTIERSDLSPGYTLRLKSPKDQTGEMDESVHFLADLDIQPHDVNLIAKIIDQFMQDSVNKHHEMFYVPEETPLFSECVVGYRKWNLADWVLTPINYGSPWRPGVNKAVCQPHGYATVGVPHEHAPAHGCHCGLNAFFEPKGIREGGNVLGAVVAWGDLQVHPDGFRAEYAQIVALVQEGSDFTDVTDLTDVAALYQVPIMPDIEALQMEASKHGSPLPESLRPAEQTSEELFLGHRYASGGLSGSGIYITGSVVYAGVKTSVPLYQPVLSPPKQTKKELVIAKARKKYTERPKAPKNKLWGPPF